MSALAGPLDAKVDDQTTKTTMLAVAGPAAEGILEAVLPFSIAGMAAGQVKFGSLMIARYIAERIDVADLWSVQVSIPNMVAGQAWRFITQKAGANSIPPVGLDAWEILSPGGGGRGLTS
jgi:glycine cleavage system aminomethyltransferase T